MKTRSESFTESDASFASSSTDDASEASSGETETSEYAATETNATSQNTSLSKGSITRVTVPRRIVIKYSANIEQPKINPPLAIIGPRDSESTDPGILSESEYSDEEEEDEDENEGEEGITSEEGISEQGQISKDEVTAADASELITEPNPIYSENDSDDDETEIEEDESTEEDTDGDGSSTASESNINGYVNGPESSKSYVLEDFELLKTIGKFCFE